MQNAKIENIIEKLRNRENTVFKTRHLKNQNIFAFDLPCRFPSQNKFVF